MVWSRYTRFVRQWINFDQHSHPFQGTLYTDETKVWNVGKLPSALSRLLPASDKGLPGVNTPYLYFGMWRATFAWHVEDMDLYSINYIHFGAPKFWYAVPQEKAKALEHAMRSTFLIIFLQLLPLTQAPFSILPQRHFPMSSIPPTQVIPCITDNSCQILVPT